MPNSPSAYLEPCPVADLHLDVGSRQPLAGIGLQVKSATIGFAVLNRSERAALSGTDIENRLAGLDVAQLEEQPVAALAPPPHGVAGRRPRPRPRVQRSGGHNTSFFNTRNAGLEDAPRNPVPTGAERQSEVFYTEVVGRARAAIGRATVRTGRFLARARAKTFSLAASGAFASFGVRSVIEPPSGSPARPTSPSGTTSSSARARGCRRSTGRVTPGCSRSETGRASQVNACSRPRARCA